MIRERFDWRPAAAMAVTLVFWSSAFPFIRVALRSYSAPHVTLLRFTFASAALLVYALVVRLRMPAWRDIPGLCALGFLNVAGYHTLLNFGLQTVQAGSGSLIVNTAPAFAFVFASRILGESILPINWLGLLISLGGAALIAAGEGKGFGLSAGALLLVGCAFTWGLSTVVTKPFLRRHTAAQVSTVSVWAGTAMLLVFGSGFGQAVRSAPISATLTVAYLGVCPIAIAYVTWSYALARMPATRASSFTYLIPVLALVTAYFVLGEKPGLLTLLGGAVALGGVVLATRGRASA